MISGMHYADNNLLKKSENMKKLISAFVAVLLLTFVALLVSHKQDHNYQASRDVMVSNVVLPDTGSLFRQADIAHLQSRTVACEPEANANGRLS